MEYQAKAQHALSLVRRGSHAEALPLLRDLLGYTYVVDFEYDDWLRALADSSKAQGNPVPAGYVYLYLHYFDQAFECFASADSREDLALCEEVRGRYAEAAHLYQECGLFARAAINLERTGDWKRAIAAWETARGHFHPDTDAHGYALSTVNLALALRNAGETTRVRGLFVEAIMIIESLADEWEGAGFLDEALGAYHILCLVGQIEQRFENLAEGYCNAIRLLKEQGQTYRTFRYYAALTQLGENLGEDHAVATLHRECADFAVRTGTLYQNFYLNQAADAYLRVAERTRETMNFPELAENAYLAAIDAYNQMGDNPQVHGCYLGLATLDLDIEKTDRYRRIAEETGAHGGTPVEIFPPSRLLLTPPVIPEVWRDELLAIETGDDPMTVLTNIVWNLEYGDVARRHALNLILAQLELRSRGEGESVDQQINIARAMGGLRYTIAYKTLRQLMGSAHAQVRAEVMRSAGRMGHPKAFLLLESGIADENEDVRTASLDALSAHDYPEAYDHLVRIYQQHSRPDVRAATIRTLGRLRSFEAAEYLLGVLRTTPTDPDEETLQRIAMETLRGTLKPEWKSVLRSRIHTEPDQIRDRLEAALR
jgi:tetratricopeptide (TPR) repeat protein